MLSARYDVIPEGRADYGTAIAVLLLGGAGTEKDEG